MSQFVATAAHILAGVLAEICCVGDGCNAGEEALGSLAGEGVASAVFMGVLIGVQDLSPRKQLQMTRTKFKFRKTISILSCAWDIMGLP